MVLVVVLVVELVHILVTDVVDASCFSLAAWVGLLVLSVEVRELDCCLHPLVSCYGQPYLQQKHKMLYRVS